MADYMDYSKIGNAFKQTLTGGQSVRKSPYVQVGSTYMQEPVDFSMDYLYGPRSKPQGPAQTPMMGVKVAQQQPTDQGTQDVGGTKIRMTDYLASHGYEELEDRFGNKRWFPVTPQEGQQYEDTGGMAWIFTNGSWVQMTRDETTGVLGADPRQPYAEDLEKALQSDDIQHLISVRNIMAGKDVDHPLFRGEGGKDAALARFDEKIADLQKQAGAPTWDPNAAVTPSWQTELTDLSDKLGYGEIEYIDSETGALDTATLREQGAMGDWFADVLEQSFDTGLIAGDFWQKNEETGALEVNPQLQDLVNNYSDEQIQQQNTFMQELRLKALQQGHSPADPYYSRVLSDYVTNQANTITSYVTDTMQREFEDQYTFIGNSIRDLLMEAGYATESEAFANAIAEKYAAAKDQFDMEMRKMAVELEAVERARRGQFISSLVGTVFAALTLAV